MSTPDLVRFPVANKDGEPSSAHVERSRIHELKPGATAGTCLVLLRDPKDVLGIAVTPDEAAKLVNRPSHG